MTSRMTITSSVGAVLNAWRNRGYDTGYSGRDENPPDEKDNKQAYDAYMAGLRLGRKERERRLVERTRRR